MLIEFRKKDAKRGMAIVVRVDSGTIYYDSQIDHLCGQQYTVNPVLT